jgi:tetratricopeptide (TPR) repeat protein
MSLLLAIAMLAAQGETPAAAPSDNLVVTMKGKDGTTATMPLEPSVNDARLTDATNFIKSGRPADAIPLLDQIIAENEKRNSNNKMLVFSARSTMEAIMYGGLAATQKKDAIVLDGNWSTAYFLKGFALIDLGRAPEAIGWFDKAVALAPMNAQFLAERGEWHKSRKDWDKAYADFEQASTAAEFTEGDAKAFEKGRALRGMAFARIEQGRLDEAKKLLKQAEKANPKDPKIQQELDYIKSLNQ